MSRMIQKSLMLLAGLSALVVAAGTTQAAAPMVMPQQMAPAFAPAAPGQGVAAFRPRFRPQFVNPRNGFGRYGMPQGRYAVRRASAWPIPVSYRPPVRMPPPRYPMAAPPRQIAYWPGAFPGQQRQAGYPRFAPAYRGSPGPRMAYPGPRQMDPRAYVRPAPGMMRPGYRPMPQIAYGSAPSVRPVQGYRPQQRGGGFYSPPRRSMTPVRYWRPPGGMLPPPMMHSPYPGRQQWRRPVPPPPQAAPGRYAGRYQPFNSPLRGQPNYRFRPMPRPFVAQRADRASRPNPPAHYQYPHNRWSGNRPSGQVQSGPWAGGPASRLPIPRREDTLAWRPQMID
ncbi:MAG: hypothetical protein OQL28_11755 [Sedimenticola sp.]|nr:hypothetical protein [Sedimenticola sp.]